jgi:hypothetical protein
MKHIIVILMTIGLCVPSAFAQEENVSTRAPKITVAIDNTDLLDLKIQAQSLRAQINLLRRNIELLKREYRSMLLVRKSVFETVDRNKKDLDTILNTPVK